MSMLTEKEIQHVAQLARIELSEKEQEKFKKELSSVLDYVNQLNRVNTDGVTPLYQTTGLINVFRSDEPMPGGRQARGAFVMDDKLNEKLVGQAPSKEERFIKVKTVLKK